MIIASQTLHGDLPLPSILSFPGNVLYVQSPPPPNLALPDMTPPQKKMLHDANCQTRLIACQVDVLECALTRHGRLVSSDMRPLHDHLCSRWRQMKEELSQLQQHQGEGSSPSPSPPVRTLSRRPSGSRRGPLPKPPPPSTATTTTMTMTAPIYESTCAEGEEEEEAAAEGLYSLPASVPVLAVATNGSTMAASPPPPPLVFLRQQHHRRQPPSWTSLSSSSSSTMMTASTPSTTSTAAATAAAPPLPPRVAGNTNRVRLWEIKFSIVHCFRTSTKYLFARAFPDFWAYFLLFFRTHISFQSCWTPTTRPTALLPQSLPRPPPPPPTLAQRQEDTTVTLRRRRRLIHEEAIYHVHYERYPPPPTKNPSYSDFYIATYQYTTVYPTDLS